MAISLLSFYRLRCRGYTVVQLGRMAAFYWLPFFFIFDLILICPVLPSLPDFLRYYRGFIEFDGVLSSFTMFYCVESHLIGFFLLFIWFYWVFFSLTGLICWYCVLPSLIGL